MKMIAKTFHGLEDVLYQELMDLGAKKIEKGLRNVSFEGNTTLLYKSNLWLRSAIRILVPIQSFRADNEDQLYAHIKNIEWDNYFSSSQTFALDATVVSDVFKNSHFVTHRAKDGIVDYFSKKYGTRPSVDIKNPNIRINIHINKTSLSVSLDSSGHSLHKRGYKSKMTRAPINEVLAAGILLLAGWKGQSDFFDPMTGSGTLAIEAVRIAHNIPANISREKFGFQNWLDYDSQCFESLKKEALKNTKNAIINVFVADKDSETLKIAEENIKNANLSNQIKIKHQDFFYAKSPLQRASFLMINPPYNQRMPIVDNDFYKNIGDTLKQHYNPCEAWVISSNTDALKSFGLRPSKRYTVFNGKLPAKLLKYEIYSGSKKSKSTT